MIGQATPFILKSNGSSVRVSYKADLVIDDDEMTVCQLIETTKGMNLFDNEPKIVKLTRKTIDSKLESEDITTPDAKKDNTHGQYIRILSHYKFDDEDDNGDDEGSHGSQLHDQTAPVVHKKKATQHKPQKKSQEQKLIKLVTV
jgi:hypothetical protein